MPNVRTTGGRLGVALAGLIAAASSSVLAQYPKGATVQSLPQANDPAELLSGALRTLAIEPNNVTALMEAGHNALILGDPNAAVGFFGRASELAPRDGRAKAGLGSALVQLEKPQDALRLFGEASTLGIPDRELAEDRGLAYDLTGDTKRAQADYATALAARPDDDTARRRLALSQGIAGEKAAAIATLDPLIRRRDIAGWRAQTFVLAMNGDAAGASYITHIMMPQQADMLQPFLVRLAALSATDKARAVHFGEMPQSGKPYTPTQLASTGAPATYAPRAAPQPAIARPTRVELADARATGGPSTVATGAAAGPVGAGATTAFQTGAVAATGPAQPTLTIAPTPAIARPIAPLGAPTTLPARPLARGVNAAPVQATAALPPTSNPTTPSAAPAAVPSAASVAPATVRATALVGPPAPLSQPSLTATQAPAAPEPATQVALAATPAPLAATAFANAQPTASAATPAADNGLPAQPRLSPQASTAPIVPPSAPAAQPATPAPVTVETGTPAATSLPTAASPSAVGHFDLPRDAAAPVKPAPAPSEKETRPLKPLAAVRKPAAEQTSEPVVEKARASNGRKAASRDTDNAIDRPRTKAKTEDRDPDTPAKGRHEHRHDDAPRDDADDAKTESKHSGHGKHASHDDGEDGRKTKTHASKDDDGDTGRKGHAKPGKADEDKGRGNPERVFVQVAGGANKDDLDKAWVGVRKKAPELMKGHTPSTTPLKATNRLLVGPFKSDDEAQAFVNKMAAKGLSSFTFKSAKGQKIEKIDSGK